MRYEGIGKRLTLAVKPAGLCVSASLGGGGVSASDRLSGRTVHRARTRNTGPYWSHTPCIPEHSQRRLDSV